MIESIKKDELIRGSIILLFMIVLFNFFNYLFQVSMAKILGPEEFGVVAVLMSIVYIISVPAETIQTIISKYTSKFNAKKEDGKIKDLLMKATNKGIKISIILFLLFIPLSLILSKILKIEFFLIILTGTILFYVFTIPIQRGILQGKKRFTQMGGSLALESFVKVIFAIFLVSLGLKAYGAILGVIISCIIAGVWIVTFMLKDVNNAERIDEKFFGIYRENFSLLIAITSIVLIYSLDIILARIFFDSRLAGQYAFVSLLGKVILFISLAISKAMFPISSQNFEEGKKTNILLKKAVIIVSGISLIISLIYFFIPEIVIKVISLGSNEYVGAAEILFILGLTYSLLSLTNVLILYRASINKLSMRKGYSFFIFVMLMIGLMFLFRQTLLSFSLAFLATSTIMFLYSLLLLKK